MDELKKLFASIAPALGSAIAGPLGGVAATFIAEKLGMEEKTVKVVTDALSGGNLTPEQVVSIQSAEREFNMFLETNKIKLEEVAAADRGSARELLKATRSKVPMILTMLITVGFFAVLGAMFYWPEVKESAPLMIMLGSLNTAWGTACAFWFGTTSGSKDKTEMLANSKPPG